MTTQPGDEIPSDLTLARRLAGWCQLWTICGRAACRRGRTCRVGGSPCFAEHEEIAAMLLSESELFARLVSRAQALAEEAEDGWDGRPST